MEHLAQNLPADQQVRPETGVKWVFDVNDVFGGRWSLGPIRQRNFTSKQNQRGLKEACKSPDNTQAKQFSVKNSNTNSHQE